MILNQEEKQIDASELNEEKISDIIRSAKTIQNRSEGLYHFVTEYRKLTKIPTPKKEDIRVCEILENVEQLWKPELVKNKIAFSKQLADKDLRITVDPNLIEQVLINLVKNSIQALKKSKNPQLAIAAFHEDNQVIIEIKDNGAGIPTNILNDIFVPFFTTKEKGSGIGLSLSRQIMRLHGGNISVQSVEKEGSVFKLFF